MDFLRNLFFQSIGIIIEEAIIFLAIFTLNFLIRLFVRKIYAQIQSSKGKMLHESFISKIVKPLRTMLWIVGIAYMIYVFVVRLQMQNNFTDSFVQFRNLVVVLCTAWLCFEIKKQVQLSFIKRFEMQEKVLDRARMDLLSKLASIIIVTLTALIALETIGVNVSTLIAFGGVGGLAIGFASKDVVANYFSGFMIHITRPFKVGDWIYTPDQALEGTVEHIGYYLTVIRGFDKRPYYVPNALFSSKMIVNASRMTNRRIRHTVGVRYDDLDRVEGIVEDIRKMAETHEAIDTKQALLVDFNEYGPSSLNIEIYIFTKTKVWKDWLSIQQDILLRVGKIIRDHGAEIAFPTTTVDVSDQLMNQFVPPPSPEQK